MKKYIPVCEPVLKGRELEYINEAVSTGWISSSGKFVDKFESEFANFAKNKYAISTTNGTTALHLALVALGIGPGDEVIIPTFTMAASAFAVCYTGATPVFVDARLDTWNIDENQIEAKISNKTKAIMSVSIFGHPSEMERIVELKTKHGLYLIEDAAESHGARYKDTLVSQFADITAYSFFANKHLTTGEGGMVTTNDKLLNDRCRYFKNMCFSLDGNRNYLHEDIGFNYRMSNLHAAIGLAQVEKADLYIDARIKNGNLYREHLAGIPGIFIQDKKDHVQHVYWMNGIVVKKEDYGHSRDQVREFLKENGIETRLFFAGMHRQPSLKKYGCDSMGAYPNSDLLTENGFYLPSGSGLSLDQIQFVCETIRSFAK